MLKDITLLKEASESRLEMLVCHRYCTMGNFDPVFTVDYQTKCQKTNPHTVIKLMCVLVV